MGKKITWGEIYRDFRSRFPRLKDQVLDYRPHDYLTIKIWCKDDLVVTYNYMTKSCDVVSA